MQQGGRRQQHRLQWGLPPGDLHRWDRQRSEHQVCVVAVPVAVVKHYRLLLMAMFSV